MRCVEKALALLLLFCLAAAASGQTTRPADGTIPYVNNAVGFEIRVPAGWSYDNSGFFGPGGAIGLLLGSAPGGLGTIQALVFSSAGVDSFPAWVEYFSKQVAALTGVERVGVESLRGARPAAYVVVDAKIGGDRIRTLYHCCELDFKQALVISYSGIAAQRSASETASDGVASVEIPDAFQKMIATLRVFRTREAEEQLAAALERGRELLARVGIRAAAGRLTVDDAERCYLIELDGAARGYLTRAFSREARSLDAGKRGPARGDRDGLRVRDEMWRFGPEGGATFSRHDLFSSLDGEMDLIEVHETIIAAPGDATEILRTRDQCVREASLLISSYTTSRDEEPPSPRSPLKLDRSYLGLAWVRLAPALFSEEAGEPIAFTIYDTDSRTLSVQQIRSLTEPAPETTAREMRVELREGYSETPALLTLDASGHMQRLESGQLTIRSASRDDVETRFAGARAAALQRAGGRVP